MRSLLEKFLIDRLVLVLIVFSSAACTTAPEPLHGDLTATQVEVLRENGFEMIDGGMLFSLSNRIIFELDSAELSPQANSIISSMTNTLLTVGISHVRLDGHTDSFGLDTYNMQLSERRAQVVAQAMKAAGFPSDAIQIRALGASRPAADNSTSKGREINRRVSVIVGSAAKGNASEKPAPI